MNGARRSLIALAIAVVASFCLGAAMPDVASAGEALSPPSLGGPMGCSPPGHDRGAAPPRLSIHQTRSPAVSVATSRRLQATAAPRIGTGPRTRVVSITLEAARRADTPPTRAESARAPPTRN